MNSKTRRILLHVAGCITFLSLPVLFAPDLPESLNIFRSIPTQRNLIAYLLMIGFFYLNFFVLIPKFYYTKRYLLFFLIILFCFIVVSLLPSFIIPEGFGRRLPPGIPNNFPRFREEPPPHDHSFPFY